MGHDILVMSGTFFKRIALAYYTDPIKEIAFSCCVIEAVLKNSSTSRVKAYCECLLYTSNRTDIFSAASWFLRISKVFHVVCELDNALLGAELPETTKPRAR